MLTVNLFGIVLGMLGFIAGMVFWQKDYLLVTVKGILEDEGKRKLVLDVALPASLPLWVTVGLVSFFAFGPYALIGIVIIGGAVLILMVSIY